MHVYATEGDEERTGGGRHPLISHAHMSRTGQKEHARIFRKKTHTYS